MRKRSFVVAASGVAVVAVVVAVAVLSGVGSAGRPASPGAGAAAGAAASEGSAGPAPSPPAAPALATADLAGTVPWIDAPAPPYRPPAAPRTPPPTTGARPCAAADVSAELTHGEGAGGHLLTPVAFTNTSRSTCLLEGYPRVVAREPGRPDVLGTDGAFFVNHGTADMEPGEQTWLGLDTSTYCPAHPDGGGSGPTYHRVAVDLPGGGTVTLDAPGFDLKCGLGLTGFYVEEPARPEPHDPLADLRASLDLPPIVAAGTPLTYVVTLTNPTGRPVALDRCPGYVEALGAATALVKEAFALNCAPVGSIAAHRSARFEMRAQVPADAPLGPVTVGWSMSGPGLLSATATTSVVPAAPADPTTLTAGVGATSFEKDLGRVLRAIGVADPGVLEHEFRGARMGGPWRGRCVAVFATRNGAAVPAPDPGSVRSVGGVQVGVFRSDVFGVQARFEIRGLTYTAASLRSRFATGTSTESAARELAAALVGELRVE